MGKLDLQERLMRIVPAVIQDCVFWTAAILCPNKEETREVSRPEATELLVGKRVYFNKIALHGLILYARGMHFMGDYEK
jgi:hypothetical protein